jgi:hypothetical protein
VPGFLTVAPATPGCTIPTAKENHPLSLSGATRARVGTPTPESPRISESNQMEWFGLTAVEKVAFLTGIGLAALTAFLVALETWGPL